MGIVRQSPDDDDPDFFMQDIVAIEESEFDTEELKKEPRKSQLAKTVERMEED